MLFYPAKRGRAALPWSQGKRRPISQTTIFAPRRTGKTAFLLNDLSPAAIKAGFRVAYADLWQTDKPALSLLRGLEEAAEPKAAAERAMALLRSPVKSVKAKASGAGVGGELEVELEGRQSLTTEVALRIDELIGALSKRRPLLLMVDEAQTLARTKEGEQLARSLRTALAKHVEAARAVFTGSSRTQLAHVFSNANAPLYSAGYAVRDFPLLGHEFVAFIAQKFHASTGRHLDVDAAYEAHLQFHSRPEALVHCVWSMVLDPNLTLEAAQQREAQRQASSEAHDGVWLSLDALQQLLVRRIAVDPNFKPFSRAALEELGIALGVDTLKATNVQRALRTLARNTVVARTPRGTWEFEDENFRTWVADK